jgi:hypothetical protein
LSSDLDRRHGWPSELRVLLDRHPRPTWTERRAADVLFWLEIHDHFRRDCVDLERMACDYREGHRTAAEIAVVAGPPLRALVAALHGHHQIEDHHYFPVFRTAAPRLATGFDLLAKDHLELARDISATAAALRELRTAVGRAGPAIDASATAALAARHYAAAASRLSLRLCRHLRDEEDLVVPLLLEQAAKA